MEDNPQVRGADSGLYDELQSQGMLVKSMMATGLPVSGQVLGLTAQWALHNPLH